MMIKVRRKTTVYMCKIMIVMILLCGFSSTTLMVSAEELTSTEASDTSAEIVTGEETEVTNILTPPDGKAEIVEQTTEPNPVTPETPLEPVENEVDKMIQGFGESEDDLVQENDLPSYTIYEDKNLETGEDLPIRYELTDSQQAVTIPANSPVPEIEESKVLEPVGNIQTTKKITVSDNAIQKAIDVAFSEMESDATSITISVGAGEYNGDITVNQSSIASGSNVDWDTFTLYILAEDSYEAAEGEKEVIDKSTITADSEGSAKVNGSINIEGINLIMAGLYWSINSTLNVKDSNTTVYGTNQNDTMNAVVSGQSNVTLVGGDGNDNLNVTSGGTTEEDQIYDNLVILSGGEGDDVMTTDISIGSNVSGVQADGGTGQDKIHFTGTLEKDSENHSVSDTPDQNGTVHLIMENTDENLFNISIINVESFTDELLNKNEVKITADNVSGNVITVAGGEAFVNYVIDIENDVWVTSQIKDFGVLIDGVFTIYTINVTNGSFLSNLVIDIEDYAFTFDDNYTVRFESINAPDMNVSISGRDMEFAGNVYAQNLTVKAYCSDVNIDLTPSKEMIDETASGLGAVNESLGESVDDLTFEDEAFGLSVGNPYANTVIKVNENATITASGSILITSVIEQLNGLVPFAAGANVLTVKVSEAYIIIDGTIIAGGSIEMSSQVKTSVTASNSSLASAFVPIAVQVAVVENHILINENAQLKAGGSIDLSTLTETELKTVATTGSLPLAISFSFVLSDTTVEILGELIAGGDINLNAATDTTVLTVSSLKVEETLSSDSSSIGSSYDSSSQKIYQNAFFLAITVVNQSTAVKILGDADLTAANDINMNSKSNLVSTTKAVAMNAQSAGVVAEKTQSTAQITAISSYITGLVTPKIKSKFSSSTEADVAATEKLLVDTEGYTITVNPTTNGSASTLSRAITGESVSIGITPGSGYSVDQVKIKYLPKGATTYVTDTIYLKDGKYTFTMPSSAVEVIVTFKATTETGASYTGSTGITSAVDALTQGQQGLEEEETVEPSANAKAITGISVSNDNNVVLGTIVPKVTTADEGTKVYVVINPTDGYMLKENTLYLVYTSSTTDSGVKTEFEQLLTKDTNGQYYFIMPDTTVTFQATFIAGTATDNGTVLTAEQGGTTSSTSGGSNATGAIALGVAMNNNDAIIDTTGTITAGGTVSVNAEALTQQLITADASPVSTPTYEPSVPTASEDVNTAVVGAQENVAVTLGGSEVTVTIAATKFGTASGTTSGITATPETGYTVDSVIMTYTYNKKVETVTLVKDGTNYVLPIGTTIPDGATVINIAAAFIGDPRTITVTSLPAGITVASSAKAGETVKILGATESQNLIITGVDGVTRVGDVYQFVMPDEDITLIMTLGNKEYDIKLDSSSTGKVTVQTAAESGESISCVLNDIGNASANNYIIQVFVTDESGNKVGSAITITNDKFTVPTLTAGQSITIYLTDDGVKTGYPMTAEATANGTITPEAAVSVGGTTYVVVTPDAGYMLKADSLIVEIQYANNKVEQRKFTAGSNGKYTVELPLFEEGTVLIVKGEFVTDPNYDASTGTTTTTTSSSSSFGMGIGVGVGATLHENNAIVENGTIIAEGLLVQAHSGSQENKLMSHINTAAGFSQGSIGITGAIGVQVNQFLTNAIVKATSSVQLDGGDLIVKSSSYESIINSAIGNGGMSASGSSMGVGSGIAVTVTGIDVKSIVEDGALKLKQGLEVINVSDAVISAIHVGEESLSAKAGSAGGISITPVAVVLVSGVATEAYMGEQEATIEASKDVKIVALSTMLRTMTADAAAAGGTVGFGGAFNIGVINDSASSRLKTSTKSRNLSVQANSRSTLKSTTKASSKGATAQTSSSSSSGTTASTTSSDDSSDPEPATNSQGSVDGQADGLLSGAGSLANQTGSSNTSSRSLGSLSGNRQTAQTSEGNVQVAAAFDLNIQANKVLAEICDGIVTITEGDLSVLAENLTDARITATAAATQSEIGVGVAVALNIVTIENFAIIGSGKVDVGGDLSLVAQMAEDVTQEKVTTTNQEESMTVFGDYIKAAITLMYTDLLMAMGIGSDEAESFSEALAEAIADATEIAATQLLSAAGLDGLISKDIETKIDSFVANLDDTVKDAAATALKDFVLNAVLSQIRAKFGMDEGSTTPSTSTGNMTLTEQMQKQGQAMANEIFAGLIDVNQLCNLLCSGDIATQLKNTLISSLKAAGKVLTTAALDGLSSYFDLKIEEIDLGSTHDIYTVAIAGAGASTVGVAGAVAIAIVNGTTQAVIRDGLSDSTINVDGLLKIYATGTHDEDTIATAAVGDDGVTPNTNLSAGGNSDVGDGSANSTAGEIVAGTGGKLIIGTTTNGKVVSFEETNTNTYTVEVSADEGYEIKSVTITRSDTGEVVDLGTGTYLEASNTWSFTKNISELAEDGTLTATANIELITYTITKNSATNGTITTVSDASGSTTSITEAGEGSLVYVTVNPESGYTLDSLEYTYTLNGSSVTKQVTQYDKVGGNVLVFYMPKADTTIKATFRALNENETPMNDNNTTTTTESGKSVGVGAGFALTIATVTVLAGVGENLEVTAGAVDIRATGNHLSSTAGVAGSDPFCSTSTSSGQALSEAEAKDIALDASVAVNLINNDIRSYVGSGTTIVTTGEDVVVIYSEEVETMRQLANGDVEIVTDSNGNPVMETIEEKTNFYMEATEYSITLSKASAFAVGSQTAVGASVAINIVDAQALVELLGSVNVQNGSATIKAYVYSEDDAYGIATAMGADLSRYTQKFKDGQSSASTAASDLAAGNYDSSSLKSSNNTNNSTADTLNSSLDNNAAADGQSTNSEMALSTNAVTSQNATTPETPDSATSTGTSTANAQSADSAGTAPTSQSTSVQVAASVAVNVTTHEALVNILNNITAKNIIILADNDSNFRTRASGAAMSLSQSSNAIAAGVAVGVTGNTAIITIGGDVIATGDAIEVESFLTQNMDGKYAGALGAQAIAGAVSGSGGAATVAGAVAILISNSETKVIVLTDNKISATGDVSLYAADKSKLATRAGGISYSKGTSVGIGAAYSLIYGNNIVTTIIGDYVVIKGNNVYITAEKLAVTFDDYKSSLGLEVLLTDSTGMTTGTYTPGIIDMKKDTTTNGYAVTFNFSTDTIVNSIDLLNFLSSNNYYIEALAGAITAPTSTTTNLNLAGAMAMLFYEADTAVVIGNNTTITALGNIEIIAKDEATARIIAGALSVSPAKAGIGFTLATLNNESTVSTVVGDSNTIQAVDYTQSAKVDNDFMVITVAGTVAMGASGNAVGATVNVLVMDNDVKSMFGSSKLDTTGDIAIEAISDVWVLLPTVSITAASNGAAAGGSFIILINETNTWAEVEENASITTSGGTFILLGQSTEELITVLAAGSGSTTGSAGAAGLHVLVSENTVRTIVGNGVTIIADGDIAIAAISDLTMIVATITVSGSMAQSAGGGVAIINVTSRDVQTIIGNSVMVTSANGDVVIETAGTDWILTIGLALSGASQNGVSGVIVVNVNENIYHTLIGEGSTILAGDSIAVSADLDSQSYTAAGAVAGGGTAGIGATITTLIMTNDLLVDIGNGTQLTALAANTNVSTAGVKTRNRETRRRGIVISATGAEDVAMVSVSGTGAGGTAVTGVINTLVMRNLANVKVNGAILNASGSDITMDLSDDDNPSNAQATSSDVIVEAEDEATIINLAGALSAAGGTGIGATVVVLVFEKEVGTAIENSQITVTGDVYVKAFTKDDLILLGFGLGASGATGVGAGVNALVFNNTTTATLGGNVVARNVTVYADSNSHLYNIAAAIGASGATAVGGVAVVTYFTNTTKAIVKVGSKIEASDDVNVWAYSQEFITADAAGIGASGAVAVGGTIDVVITEVVTQAYTEMNVTIQASGDVTILANDSYDLVAVVVSVAGSGATAVTVTALVSVSFNTIHAEVGYGNAIEANNLGVIAQSNRDIVTAVTGAVGSGGVAVGVGISVVVAGNKMSQDAHDALFPEGGMNIITQFEHAFAQGDRRVTNSKPTDLAVLLEGDGQHIEPTTDYTDYGQEDGAAQDSVKQDYNINATPVANMADTTSAIIKGGTVTTAQDVNVIANDDVNVVMVSMVAAGSGTAAVGVSISLGLISSNVVARMEQDTTVTAGGTITVKAASGKLDLFVPTQSRTEVTAEQQNILDEMSDKGPVITLDQNTPIMLVSFNAAGAGVAGVSVDLAALVLFSKVQAVMAGDVTQATNVTVESNMEYDNVMIAMVGLGGGSVAGVVVETAIVYFAGESSAIIANESRMDNVTEAIGVLNSGHTTASANFFAVTVGGMAAVTVGVATVINKTNLATYIGEDAIINISGNLILRATFESDASVYAGGMAVGTVGIVVTVAVVVNQLYSYTGIGTNTSAGGVVNAKDVQIISDMTANTEIRLLELSLGGIGGNAGVAVGYNEVTGIAKFNQMDLNTNSITITALLDGDMLINVNSISGGVVAFGVTVAVGVMESKNYAVMDVTDATIYVATSISINGGTADQPTNSTVNVMVITGTIGAVAIGVNVGTATNDAVNVAELYGNNSRILYGDIIIKANGNSQAYVIIGSAGIGGVASAVSTAVATITSEQYARIVGTIDITTGCKVEIESLHNLSGEYNNHLLLDYGEGYTDYNKEIAKTAMSEAYIFAFSKAIGSLNVNTVVATANARSDASVEVQTLNANYINVTNRAMTMAIAKIDNWSSGCVNVGVMTAYAYADGTYNAYVTVHDTASTVGVWILNVYDAYAFALVTPASGGVANISLASVKVNTAIAETRTVSRAYIAGPGTINATGDVSITNVGNATATARVVGLFIVGAWDTSNLFGGFVAVDVTSNVANAAIRVDQRAYVTGATIHANNLQVISKHNVVEDALYDAYGNPYIPTPVDGRGAFATVGANYGTVSLVAVSSNVATATADAIVSSFLENTSANIQNRITVYTFASSVATADVEMPDQFFLFVEISLADVGVAVMTTNANGQFRAFISDTDQTGRKITAGELFIGVGYYTWATSYVGPLGGTGVSISGLGIVANVADATTRTIAEAFVNAKYVTIVTTGNVLVKVNGFSVADSKVTTDTVTIKLINAAANVSYATVAVTQNAYMVVHQANIGGNLSIISRYMDQGSRYNNIDQGDRCNNGAYASSGTSNIYGVELTLISLTGYVAEAKSTLVSNAYIKNGDLLADINVLGNLTVLAESVTWTYAVVTKPTSVSVASITLMLAKANATDTVKAYIAGAKVVVGGFADIQAIHTANATAEGASGPSIALIVAGGGSVFASLGDGLTPHIVEAYVSEYAQLIANGPIQIIANSTGNVKSRMTEGINISFLGFGYSSVPTYMHTQTNAIIGNGAIVKSMSSKVIVSAYSYGTADALVDGTSIGILVSADYKYAQNTIYQYVQALIGNSVTVYGDRGIDAIARADVYMLATTNANSAGIFNGGTVKAYNELHRTVDVVVYENATLEVHTGDIYLFAHGGEKDVICTTAITNSAALVGFTNMEAITAYNSYNRVTVRSGATLTSYFGNVILLAYVSARDISSCAEYKGEALYDDPEVLAQFSGNTGYGPDATKAILHASVLVWGANINANVINIQSKLAPNDATLKINIRAVSDSLAAGANVDTKAYTMLSVQIDTKIQHSTLYAYEDLIVWSVASAGNPSYCDIEWGDFHINTEAFGVVSSIWATSELIAYGFMDAYSYVCFSDNVVYTANLNVGRSWAGFLVHRESASGKTESGINWKNADQNWAQYDTPYNKVEGWDNTFYIFTEKMIVDVYYDDNGNVQVRSKGTSGDFAPVINDGVVELGDITTSNRCYTNVMIQVIEMEFVRSTFVDYGEGPDILITNETDYDLTVAGFNNEIELLAADSIVLSALTTYLSFYDSQYIGNTDLVYDIKITSKGSGDVTFTESITEPNGTLMVEWSDGKKGNVYNANQAVIKVAALEIKNAIDIGREDVPFLINVEYGGLRNVSAYGSGYLSMESASDVSNIYVADRLTLYLPSSGEYSITNVTGVNGVNIIMENDDTSLYNGGLETSIISKGTLLFQLATHAGLGTEADNLRVSAGVVELTNLGAAGTSFRYLDVVNGNVELGYLSVDSSVLKITAREGTITIGALLVIRSTVEIESKSDVDVDNIRAEESNIKITGWNLDQDCYLGDISVTDSNIKVEAFRDIRFKGILAKASNIQLHSNGMVGNDQGVVYVDGVETEAAYIVFADGDTNDNASLSMSAVATGDMIYIDMPDSMHRIMGSGITNCDLIIRDVNDVVIPLENAMDEASVHVEVVAEISDEVTRLNGWQNTDEVVLEAPEGFVISTSNAEDATWSESILIATEDGKNVEIDYYLKNIETQQVSEIKTFTYNNDRTDATGSFTVTGTDVEDNYINGEGAVIIQANDSLSGVSKVEYQIVAAGESYDMDGTWVTGSSVLVDEMGTFVVYARITDYAGNVVVIQSDDIVVYQDSVIESTDLDFVKSSEAAYEVVMKTNGNIVKEVKVDDIVLNPADYEIITDGDTTTITFAREYIHDLGLGDKLVTVSYEPIIVGDDKSSIETSFTVSIVEMITDTTVKEQHTVYNGSNQSGTGATGTAEVGIDVEILYSGDEGHTYTLTDIPTYKDAGTYTIYYQLSAINHKTIRSTLTYTIQKKVLTWTEGTVEDKVYDGTTTANVLTQPTLNGVIDGDVMPIIVIGSVYFTDENVGENQEIIVMGYGINSDNYLVLIDQPTFANADITPRIITVRPNSSQSAFYGEAVDIKYIYIGMLEKEIPCFKGTLGIADSKWGTYDINLGTLGCEDSEDGGFLAGNYELAIITGETFTIDSYEPIEEVPTSDEWITNEDIILTAPEGFLISTSDDLNDANWSFSLKVKAIEGEGKEVVYYLRNITTGAISTQKIFTYNYDGMKLPIIGVIGVENSGFSSGGIVPQTGDDLDIIFYLMMMLIAMHGVVILTSKKRKMR